MPFTSPGNLPDPGIKPRSLALQADSLPSEIQGKLLYIWNIIMEMIECPSFITNDIPLIIITIYNGILVKEVMKLGHL